MTRIDQSTTSSHLESELQFAMNELRLQKFALDEHAIVAITDPSGVITYVNEKFCAISKYTREELIGQTHRVINSGYHPKSFFIDMWRTICSGETWHGEVCNRARDGTIYWVDTTIVPFKDREGRVTSYTAIRADITERKATELKLAEANAKLQKTNEELEQFVYTASHDLKSPIVTLKGYLGLLRNDVSTGRQDRLEGFLDRLEAASVKLGESVNDLLELSRVGHVPFEPVEISVNRLVDSIVRSHELEIQESGIRIEVDEPLPEICFDLQRMDDMLDNLITNAIKYGCGADDPLIRVYGEELEGEIRICVRDNGDGIDPKYHQKLFSIFERLDTSKEGSGIGLAIVKKIIESQGGRVFVESEPGSGAAFWLVFPKDGSPGLLPEMQESGGAK